MKRTLVVLALVVVGCGRKAEPVKETAPDTTGAAVQPNAASAALGGDAAVTGPTGIVGRDIKRDPNLNLDPHMKKMHDERMKAQRENR